MHTCKNATMQECRNAERIRASVHWCIGALVRPVIQFSWASASNIRDTWNNLFVVAGVGWTVTLNPAAADAALTNIVINEFLAANVSTNGLKDENGAALIEYTVLLGILLIAVIATIGLVGTWVSKQWLALDKALSP